MIGQGTTESKACYPSQAKLSADPSLLSALRNRYAASESQGSPVEQVYTFGGIARWPGASELLSRMAGTAVADTIPLAAVFDPSDAEQSGQYAGIGPELAVATGLALRGMAADD